MTEKDKYIFETWLYAIGDLDPHYIFLRDKQYKEEREAFMKYYNAEMTPWKALQKEYAEYS